MLRVLTLATLFALGINTVTGRLSFADDLSLTPEQRQTLRETIETLEVQLTKLQHELETGTVVVEGGKVSYAFTAASIALKAAMLTDIIALITKVDFFDKLGVRLYGPKVEGFPFHPVGRWVLVTLSLMALDNVVLKQLRSAYAEDKVVKLSEEEKAAYQKDIQEVQIQIQELKELLAR